MHTTVARFLRAHYITPLITLAVLLVGSVTIADIISGASSTNSSTDVTVTQITIDKPASVAQGDFLLAQIAINGGSPATVTNVPSGWVQILRTDNDTSISIASYYKIAGASEASNYTWSISPQTRAEGGITRYSGVDTSNPIDAASGNFGLSQVATTSSITTSAANEEVVALFGTDVGKNHDAGDYFSLPTGMTEKYDATNVTLGPSIAAFDVLQVSAGSSGSKSSTVSGNKNRNWAAQQIALRRAPIGHISVETGANGATSFASTGPATTFTFSKSVSASSTLLIVHFPLSDATGVTYDGIPMNVATSGLSSPTYYLVNPPSGTHDVVATRAASGGALGSAVSYTGTDTANPFGAMSVAQGYSGPTTVVSTTINTIYNGSIIDDSVMQNIGTALSANSPQVQLVTANTGGEFNGVSTLQTTSAGSYPLGWSASPDFNWVETAIEIKAAQ